ncbi:MAG: septation protein A [Gammaproteobacteria bacterium]|nr:septation protein A [Gammaproteobacteria bacterium]MCP5407020.1 septation protein A [Chromatiaceae bacterium]MCP5445134.1 septation protein A [Chromatiaceae bacterium]
MKFLADFLPIVLFFFAYQLYDIYVATAVAIVASVLQVGYSWLFRKKIEKMHLVTLGLLVVFGGLTLALRDPLFIKWKPTVVNWLFATVFLGSQFVGKKSMVERMMSHAIELPANIWTRLNISWGIFFLGSGILNLYVAFNFSEETWVNFKLFGMLGLTVVFVVLQSFYMARHIQDQKQEET